MPRWCDAPYSELIVVTTYALKFLGGRNARAFTLNLGPAEEQRATADSGWMRRRLVYRVGSQVPMLIVFDAEWSGRLLRPRLHVHGVFVAEDESDVMRILRGIDLAGGDWAARSGRKHKLVSKELGDSSGPIFVWADYLRSKLAPASRVIEKGALWSVTNVARRAAQGLHADVRRVVNGSRGHPMK
jgi:hypothetical protein